MTVRPDPPVRQDNLCVVCLEPRKIPKSRHRAEAELDPFCSNNCCRAYHEKQLTLEDELTRPEAGANPSTVEPSVDEAPVASSGPVSPPYDPATAEIPF